MKLPNKIKQNIGYALYLAQKGEMSDSAKVLKGFGSAGIIEMIDSDSTGTYRAVYTIKMTSLVFVLHIFQKKSKQGIKTPQKDIELINTRLKQAQEVYKNRQQIYEKI